MIITEQDLIDAAKFGYDYHKTSRFPEREFEEECINNFKQVLAGRILDRTMSIIENLFTDKYTHDEKMRAMSELELENPPLLDALIKQHQPLFWSEVPMVTLSSQFGEFAGYEKHIMSFNLIKSLDEYKKNNKYNPAMDFYITQNIQHLVENK